MEVTTSTRRSAHDNSTPLRSFSSSPLSDCRCTSARFLLSRYSGQHALKIFQRRSNVYPASIKGQLTDAALMRAAAFLHHGYRLLHLAGAFKVAEQDNGIGNIAQVQRRC